MEAVLEAIFGNFMIVIIIIGGIISFLKDKSGKEKQERQQSDRPYRKPNMAPASSDGGYQTRKNDPRHSAQKQQVSQSSSAANSISIEEQQAEQLKKLAGRVDTGVDQTLGEMSREVLDKSEHPEQQPRHKKPRHHRAFQKRIKRNISHEGLAESVIMAEVLGAPRAVRPYRPTAKGNRIK